MNEPTPQEPDFSALSPLADEVAATVARVASDIALVIDADGVIRTVAEGGTPLPSGASGWVGRRWVDTATADTRRKIELLLDELQATGVSQRREVNHPGTDGDDVPMAWTAIRLGAQGPVLAVGRDLRAVAAIQRRFLDAQHEMELDYWQRRHADNRYRLLFQVARDGVMVVDAMGFELTEANDAAIELLRLPDGSGGQPLTGLMAEPARAALVELLSTARSTGRAGEIRLRMHAGSPPCSVSATPFRAGDRHQLLVRVRCADDTTDAQLPAVMRTLVESTPDAVVVTDSSGRIQVANPAFLSLVDQGSESHVKGRSLSDVTGNADAAWSQLIERTRRHGLCMRVALGVRRGGLDMAVEASSTLLTEGEQEHLGFTIRLAERAGADLAPDVIDAWPTLSVLKAQIGMVPLVTLLQDAGEEIERQFLQAALHMAGQQVPAAARLLRLEPSQLSSRMRALGIGREGDRGNGHGNGHGGNGAPPSDTLN